MAEKSNDYLENLLATKVNAESIRDSEEKDQLLFICNEINERCKTSKFDVPMTLDAKAQRYVEKINESLKLRGLELKLIKKFEASLLQISIDRIFQKASQASTPEEAKNFISAIQAIAKLGEMMGAFNGEEKKLPFWEYHLQILLAEKKD